MTTLLGLRVTTAARALIDVAKATGLIDQIERGIAETLDRGLATTEDFLAIMKRTRMSSATRMWLVELLADATTVSRL